MENMTMILGITLFIIGFGLIDYNISYWVYVNRLQIFLRKKTKGTGDLSYNFLTLLEEEFNCEVKMDFEEY